MEVVELGKEKLSDEARKARNAYARKWRKDNPDKVKKHNERYWEKKAKEIENK